MLKELFFFLVLGVEILGILRMLGNCCFIELMRFRKKIFVERRGKFSEFIVNIIFFLNSKKRNGIVVGENYCYFNS